MGTSTSQVTPIGGGTNGFDNITLKYNSSGALQWVQAYNGSGNSDDYANALALDASNNVYVTGSVYRGSDDIVLLKYNTNGDLQWVRVYNGAGNGRDIGFGLAIDSGNNVVVTGSADRGGTNGTDCITIKYDSTGTALWIQVYNGGTNAADMGYTVAIDNSDNVIVTGESNGAGNQDYLTAKYNSAGVTQWVKRYNGTANSVDRSFFVATDALGNIYVTGMSRGTGTNLDWATLKYDSSGVQQWVRRTRTSGIDAPNGFFVDSSNNVYVAGYVTGNTSGGTTGTDSYVVKYNSSGTPTFSARYNGVTNNFDGASAVTAFGGNIYVAINSDNDTTSDIVIIKYVP